MARVGGEGGGEGGGESGGEGGGEAKMRRGRVRGGQAEAVGAVEGRKDGVAERQRQRERSLVIPDHITKCYLN